MLEAWGSPWKQGCLLNDLKSQELDIIAVNETRISNAYALVPMFSRPGMGDGVVVLFRKELGLKVKPIFLDTDRRLVVLDVNSREGIVSRLGAKQADFFRCWKLSRYVSPFNVNKGLEWNLGPMLELCGSS